MPVKEVVEAFAAAEWLIKFFPPNMTDELQPMDLIVNAVLKAEMRALRINMVFDSLQVFRALLKQWSLTRVGEQPSFDPPKPNYKDAVKTMLFVHQNKLCAEEFIVSLSKCFKKVGLVPEEGKYNPYRAVKLGEVKKEKGLTSNDCVAGWCIDLTTRRDVEEVAAEAPTVQVPKTPLEILIPVVVEINSDSESGSDVEISAVGDDIVDGGNCDEDGEIDDEELLDVVIGGEAVTPVAAAELAEIVNSAGATVEVRASRIRKHFDKNAAWENK